MSLEAIHPARPAPVVAPSVEFLVVKGEDGKNVVALSWEDYLRLGKFMKRLEAWIKANNLMVCHYREKLKEPECSRGVL